MKRAAAASFLLVLLMTPAGAKASAAAQADVVLVEDGTPRAAILVPADAPDRAGNAAAMLAAHVEWMSGARLPVVRETKDHPFAAKDLSLIHI